MQKCSLLQQDTIFTGKNSKICQDKSKQTDSRAQGATQEKQTDKSKQKLGSSSGAENSGPTLERTVKIASKNSKICCHEK